MKDQKPQENNEGRAPALAATAGYAAIARERIAKMREALTWIATQGCEGDTGHYERCRDLPKNPCITEYCYPCYAAEALEQDDRDAEWEKRREGLDDQAA